MNDRRLTLVDGVNEVMTRTAVSLHRRREDVLQCYGVSLSMRQWSITTDAFDRLVQHGRGWISSTLWYSPGTQEDDMEEWNVGDIVGSQVRLVHSSTFT